MYREFPQVHHHHHQHHQQTPTTPPSPPPPPGGLLSAYYVSEDPAILAKATEIGHALAPGFLSRSGVPHSDVNLKTGRAFNPGGSSSLSEATSVQLEFKYLSHLTGVAEFRSQADRAMTKIHEARLNSNDQYVCVWGGGGSSS